MSADNAATPANLITFDQAEFFELNPSLYSMARDRYVPSTMSEVYCT